MKQVGSGRESAQVELNLTSMIDVVFLLLIFFVFTTDFKAPEKQLPTKLGGKGAIATEFRPKNQEERDLDKTIVRVFLDRSGNAAFEVGGRRAGTIGEVEDVLIALQEIAPEATVVVAPERNVPIERALDAYDAARRAGLSTIKFAASPEAFAK